MVEESGAITFIVKKPQPFLMGSSDYRRGKGSSNICDKRGLCCAMDDGQRRLLDGGGGKSWQRCNRVLHVLT